MTARLAGLPIPADLEPNHPRQRTITVYRSRDEVYRSRDEIRVLSGGDVLDGAEVVPGWKLALPDLFA